MDPPKAKKRMIYEDSESEDSDHDIVGKLSIIALPERSVFKSKSITCQLLYNHSLTLLYR